MSKNKVVIENISFGYDQKNLILNNININVEDGEFLCIIGPSGCGKSTLIHLLAGFINAKVGTITINSSHVSDHNIKKSVVFQKHNLFPWKSVLENMTLALRTKGLSKNQAKEKTQHYLNLVGLNGHENKYPCQLSLGMQQRVGIARAFSEESELLLMDEPFGSLDAQTRLKMQKLLFSIRQNESKTIFFVTHDIDEALLLADRIIVLSNSPATIRYDIKLNFPHPRTSQSLVTTEASEIRKNIFDLLL